MSNWKISLLVDDSEEENTFELMDLDKLLNGYSKINRSFFDDLLESVKKSKKYAMEKNIQAITDPKDNDRTKNPWIFIIAKEIESKIPYWILLQREKDLSGLLVAVGPKTFTQYIKKQGGEELKKILEYVVTYPQNFTSMIAIPEILESED